MERANVKALLSLGSALVKHVFIFNQLFLFLFRTTTWNLSRE